MNFSPFSSVAILIGTVRRLSPSTLEAGGAAMKAGRIVEIMMMENCILIERAVEVI
jgi:hypothetical protein